MGLAKGHEGLSEGFEGLPEGPEAVPEGPVGLPEGPKGMPEGPKGLPGGLGDGQSDGWTYRRTDGRTDGISPPSTGIYPLSGPLPKKVKLLRHLQHSCFRATCLYVFMSPFNLYTQYL